MKNIKNSIKAYDLKEKLCFVNFIKVTLQFLLCIKCKIKYKLYLYKINFLLSCENTKICAEINLKCFKFKINKLLSKKLSIFLNFSDNNFRQTRV